MPSGVGENVVFLAHFAITKRMAMSAITQA